jgi:hypothetical protein
VINKTFIDASGVLFEISRAPARDTVISFRLLYHNRRGFANEREGWTGRGHQQKSGNGKKTGKEIKFIA